MGHFTRQLGLGRCAVVGIVALVWGAAGSAAVAQSGGGNGGIAAPQVRFIVAEVPGSEFWHDSYTLTLTNPADIAHARRLITDGLSAGEAIVVARIEAGADGVNRNWRAAGAPVWHWHVTQFETFADATVEILDGTPGGIENDPQGWIQGPAQGRIGFWGYTVVGELPLAADPACPADYDGNGLVEPGDIALFVNTWYTSLASGSLAGDFDGNGHVQPADLAFFVQVWFAGLTGGC